MTAELLVLRVVHVLGAIIWVGTSLFMAFLLMPALGTLGPAGGPVVGALHKRKLFTIIPIVAVLTMLAGARLMMLTSAGFAAAYFSSRLGKTYTIGALSALIAFIVFMSISHPAIGRIMKLGPQIAQAPDSERGPLMAEMAALRARGGMASKASALLLTATAIAMALGRYV